MLFTEEEETL